jgi:hypothetical protein
LTTPPLEGASKKKNLGEFGCTMLAFLVIVLLASGLPSLRESLWGEREGTIKTDDYRTRIVVKEGSHGTWFKTFTCTYRKTNKGTLMSGYCEAVETTNAGACDTVYFYEKQAPKVCTDPKFPYLGVDDMCHTDPQ